MSYLISEGVAPSTPASGKVAVYAKTDGRVYGKDDAGSEFTMSGLLPGTYTALSGTSTVVSGIPAGTKQIIILGVATSSTGTDTFAVRLGDSGGLETTGYVGAVESGGTSASLSANISLNRGATAAAGVYNFFLQLTLADPATNTWVFSGQCTRSDVAVVNSTQGYKSLSDTLTQFDIFTGGAGTWDAGSFNYYIG